MMENSSENIKAYTEVNCLLEYLPQSYIDRLPRKLIDLIKGQSDKRYNINIDTDKSLLDQGFSKKAKDLITVLHYNYWATNEEKQQLNKIFYENEIVYQKELLEKYNSNDIFKKKKTKMYMGENGVSNFQMVKYKENIFVKFLTKIKNVFRKNEEIRKLK